MTQRNSSNGRPLLYPNGCVKRLDEYDIEIKEIDMIGSDYMNGRWTKRFRQFNQRNKDRYLHIQKGRVF